MKLCFFSDSTIFTTEKVPIDSSTNFLFYEQARSEKAGFWGFLESLHDGTNISVIFVLREPLVFAYHFVWTLYFLNFCQGHAWQKYIMFDILLIFIDFFHILIFESNHSPRRHRELIKKMKKKNVNMTGGTRIYVFI